MTTTATTNYFVSNENIFDILIVRKLILGFPGHESEFPILGNPGQILSINTSNKLFWDDRTDPNSITLEGTLPLVIPPLLIMTDVPGCSLVLNVNVPKKFLIMATVPAVTDFLAGFAIGSSQLTLDGPGNVLIERQFNCFDVLAEHVSSPAQLTIVLDLSAGIHVINLRARCWSATPLANVVINADTSGYVGSNTYALALKSTLTIIGL